jgi:hypothetical protein
MWFAFFIVPLVIMPTQVGDTILLALGMAGAQAFMQGFEK